MMDAILPRAITETVTGVSWTLILRDNLSLARQFQEIMSEMDRHYAGDDWSEAFALMTGPACRYFVGSRNDAALAIGYQWSDRLGIYQIRSAGFRGTDPQSALELFAAQVKGFLSREAQAEVFVVLPHYMDNPRIMQLHSLIPWTPGWRVSGGRHVGGKGVEGGTYWRIAPT